jgi:hypothetical protein
MTHKYSDSFNEAFKDATYSVAEKRLAWEGYLIGLQGAKVSLAQSTNSEKLLKSSNDWQIEKGIVVLDPDGWDRLNYQASWDELISESEFSYRLNQSTSIRMPAPFPDRPCSKPGQITGVKLLEDGYTVKVTVKGELSAELRTLGTHVQVAMVTA